MANPLVRSLSAGFGDEEAAASIREENAARAVAPRNPTTTEYAAAGALEGNANRIALETEAKNQLAADNQAAIAAVQTRKGSRDPNGMEISGRTADNAASHRTGAEGAIDDISAMKPVTQNDPLHGPVQKHNAVVREARGTAYGALQDEQAVDRMAAEKYKERLTEEFSRAKADADAADAIQQVRQQRLYDQEDSVKAAKMAQSAAIERLSSAPPEDAGRFWANTPAWKKFLYAISSGLLGAAGMDPFAHIQTAIQQDIESQRSGLKQLDQVVNQSRAGFEGEQGIYAQILETVQDERTADLILQNARWREAEAKMQQMVAEIGQAAMGPQQEQLLARVRESIAKGELQLEQLAIAHPKSRTRMVHSMNATERGLRTEMFKHDLKREGANEDASTAIAADTAKETAKNAGGGPEGSLEERKHDLAERRFAHEQKTEITGTDKDKMVDAAIGAIDSYVTDYGDDIPDRTEGGALGRAWASMDELGFNTEAGKKERNRRAIIGQWALTGLTGAVVSPHQKEFMDQLINGHDMSGDTIRSGLADLREVLRLQRAGALRAAEDSTVRSYSKTPEGEITPPMEPLRGRGRPRPAADETYGGTER